MCIIYYKGLGEGNILCRFFFLFLFVLWCLLYNVVLEDLRKFIDNCIGEVVD